MKQRNPWKSACLLLTASVLATGAYLYSGSHQLRPTEGSQEEVVPSEQVLNPTVTPAPQTASEEVEIPKDQSLPPDMKADEKDVVPPPLTEPKMKNFKFAHSQKTAKLVVHVIDGRTGKPIQGAENVLIETGERFTTDATGTTKAVSAPVIRETQYSEQVAALHGQLGLITYKNGYRDSITLNVRMHEGKVTDVTVWMYQITPGDRRIEPLLYQEPYHHLWLVELADAYRSPSQPGAGQESPER